MFNLQLFTSHNIGPSLIFDYDQSLLVFSALLVFISCYNILLIIERLIKEWQQNKIVWIIAATVSFGIGLFSMHFIALQALKLPIPVSYDLSLSLLSIIPALISALVILYALIKKQLSFSILIFSGVVFSTTLFIMHHMGIVSMQMDAQYYYLAPATLGILAATIVASVTLILLLRRLLKEIVDRDNQLLRTAAALLMTLTLAFLHFAMDHGLVYVAVEKQMLVEDISNWIMLIAVLVLQMLAILFSVSVFLGRKSLHMKAYGDLNTSKIKNLVYRQTLIIFLPMLMLILVLSAMGLFVHESMQRAQNANDSMAQTELISSLVVQDFDDIIDELQYQARDPLLGDFLSTPNPEDESQLIGELLALSKVKKIFNQIRILNLDGHEMLRIDYENGDPIAVSREKLQDKSHRYYFHELIELEPDSFYVSRFDLNVENEKLEIPIKPMIRFASPVYNLAGQRVGYIMFNYSAQIILKEIREQIAEFPNQLFLLNEQGYYLIGPSFEQEWGFMFEHKHSFKRDYPKAWDNIHNQEQGHFEVRKKHFSFATIGAVSGKNAGFSAPGETERWKVVISIDISELDLSTLLEHPVSIIFIIVLIVFTLFIAWSTALNLVYRKLAEREQQFTLKELNFQKFALDEHAIVSITDASGKITYINDKFVQISGYSRDELLGQTHALLKSGYHSNEFYQQMWQVVSSGKSWHGEFKNRAKDGSTYWVQSTIVPELDQNQIPCRYISIRTDITQQKNNETRLANAQTIANVGDWKHNLKTGKITWSDQCYRIFGYSPGGLSLNFKNIAQTIHPEDREQFIQTHTQFKDNDDSFFIECRIIHPNGEVRYIDSMANILRDEQQKPIQLTGVIHDITQHKLAEQEISKLFQAVESSASIVIVTDFDGVIEYINPAFTQITGYQADEVIGHTTNLLRSETTSDQICHELWQTIVAGKTWKGEFRNICKDGSHYWASVTISPVIENGRITHFTAIQQDITERKMMEDRLRQQQQELTESLTILTESRNQLKLQAKIQAQLKEKAEKADRAKSEFLSAMSHELRTPLNSILGFAQIIEYKSEQPLTPTQKVCVEHIIKGGKHLLELINEILDLTKIESGKMSVALDKISLHPLVDECLSLIKSIADDKQTHLQWTEDDHPLLKTPKLNVRADKIRLKQVIINLLTNAIKYSPSQSKVSLSSQMIDEQMLRLTITDNGQGIPSDKHYLLFQPFSRIESLNSEVEGTGIGLALSKKIIELMGGQIGFSSVEGEGSSFWIDIPIAHENLEPNQLLPRQPDFFDSNPDQSDIVGTLLYIEDNPASQSLMQELVTQITGLRLLCAHSAEQGLKLARSHKANLILLDINLPGINGFEALKQLQSYPETASTPVIALSANAMPEDIQKGLDAGFQQYLTKPIDINHMLHTLKGILGV